MAGNSRKNEKNNSDFPFPFARSRSSGVLQERQRDLARIRDASEQDEEKDRSSLENSSLGEQKDREANNFPFRSSSSAAQG